MTMATVTFRNERTNTLIDARAGSRWSHRANDVGTGMVTVGLEDNSQIAPGDLITALWDGADAFTFIAERDEAVVMSAGGDGAAKRVAWSGPGVAGELDGWVIGPPNGEGVVPVGHEWRFDWSTADISGWSNAVERSTVIDRTALPPYGLAGMPVGFPNPLSYWLSSRAAVPASADPVGVFYAGCDFTLATSSADYLLFWIADDRAQIALNEALIDQYTGDGMAVGEINVVELTLPAGNYKVRAKVENLARDHPQNCGLFAACLGRKVYSGAGFTLDWEWRTCVDDGWKTLDYGASPPGSTWGKIMARALTRAQAESSATGWTLSCTDTHDSDGNAWPTVTQRFGVGMSPLGMLAQGVDAGEVEWRNRGRVLDVFVAGTTVDAATLPSSDIQDLTWVRDGGKVAGRIRTRDDQGRVATVGSSGRMVYAAFGGVDPERVPAVAAAQLARLGVVAESVTAGVPVGGGCDPYADYSVLDALTVPTRDLAGTVALAVSEIVVSTTETGVPRVASTLRSREQHRLELSEKRMVRVAPGIVSEVLAPVLPGQRIGMRLRAWQQTWSWSGKASDVAPLEGPREELETVTWVNRVDVLVNDDGGGSTATAIEMLIDGSLPGLPGIGDLSLGAADVWDENNFVYAGQPGEWLSMRFGSSVGDHTTGRVRMFGVQMPA